MFKIDRRPIFNAIKHRAHDATRRFINEPARYRLEAGTLRVGKIFGWCGGTWTPIHRAFSKRCRRRVQDAPDAAAFPVEEGLP
jgi:G:T/U-mismatch repair DNA glycosylase